MTLRTARRLLMGFIAGISAGWVGGLLRTPRRPPVDSSAAEAASLPQHRFGSPPDSAFGARPPFGTEVR
jgi:hypothetical protein